MGKKKKLISLSDEDIELLQALQGELQDEGVSATQSDIVSMGLRELRKQGGPIAIMRKKAKREAG